MKILHLIKSLGRGGAEMLLPETIRLHNKEQFEFHCIYFLPWKNQMVEALLQQGAVVTCLAAKSNLRILMKVPSLIRYIKENKIDVVHSHLPWAGFAARIIHKRTGVPVIYTEHNKQERYHTATRLLNKYTFNWQSQVLTVSNDVEQSIRKNIDCKIPIATVLNGVNTENFQHNEIRRSEFRRQLGIEESTIVIGNVAVFRFQKRLAEWLEVIKAVHQSYPTIRAVLVGAGPLENEVKAKVSALGLQEVVITPGLQTNTVDWFSIMDIFMMSSEFEGLPVALLEAMSCSCAAVSTNAGGIKEVIRHEKDGLLVDIEDWNKLPGQLNLLIESPALLDQFKLAARNRVVSAFSLVRMVNQLEALYNEANPNSSSKTKMKKALSV